MVFPDRAFIFCGTKASEDETLDRLDLWRAYGADGYGIAITTVWSRKGLIKDGLHVLPVKYVADKALENLRTQYEELQTQIDKANSDNKRDKARELYEQRMDLEVGYKTLDYQSEDELRIVYYADDQSGAVSPYMTCSAESGRLRVYVTRKVKVGINQTLSGLYITIGPRVPKYEASHWKMMADWTVRQLGLSGSQSTCQSRLTYVG